MAIPSDHNAHHKKVATQGNATHEEILVSKCKISCGLFTEEKSRQAGNPCHIAMLAMHFLEKSSRLEQQQLFCARSSIFSSALCRGVEKERNDHHWLAGWQQPARRVLYTTHRKETSPFYAFSAARTTKGARRKESHSAREYIHPACSFQSVLRFRCLAVKSHCVDQPGSARQNKNQLTRLLWCKRLRPRRPNRVVLLIDQKCTLARSERARSENLILHAL
jgi:hypothetical protein